MLLPLGTGAVATGMLDYVNAQHFQHFQRFQGSLYGLTDEFERARRLTEPFNVSASLTRDLSWLFAYQGRSAAGY